MALTTIPVELLTLDDGVTITVDDNSNALTITSTDADASVGPGLDLYRNSSSPADNDVLGTIFFHGEDGAGNKTEYARIEAGTDDVSNGAEAGSLTVFTNNADTLTNNRFEINSLGLVINEVGGNFDTRIESDGNANMLFVDAGNNTVSIGSNSSDGTLHVESGSAGTITSAAAANELVLESDGPVGMSLLFDDEANDAYGNIYWGNETDGNADGRITYFGSTYVTAADRQSMVFRTAGTERIRIDSSGVLMLGKTSSSTLTAGVEARQDGTFASVKDGGGAAVFGRLTDDGTIVTFRKDTTSIGGIGTLTGDLTIFSSTASHVGLRFGNTRLQPTDNTGATSDGASDLGFSNSRFKDLYISGNVKVASGQGVDFSNAPNSNAGASHSTLDDYEEGAFTPQLYGGSTSVTVSNAVGRYTKIGNLVSVWGSMTRNDANSITGNLQLRNMPFTAEAVSNLVRMGMGFIWMDNGSNLDRVGNVYLDGNTYAYGVVDFDVRTGRYLQISSMTNGRPIYFSFCYQTGQ